MVDTARPLFMKLSSCAHNFRGHALPVGGGFLAALRRVCEFEMFGEDRLPTIAFSEDGAV